MDLKVNPQQYVIVIALALIIVTQFGIKAQTASEILKRSVQYHDPNGIWQHFEAQLDITMAIPDDAERHSVVSINRKTGHFEMSVEKDGVEIFRSLKDGNCEIRFNGQLTFSDEVKEQYGLTCERTKMYRNYYTYLYGLPMKIEDDGARLDPVAQKAQFMAKTYWKLKVTYDESVGSDTWYFYINPDTYALEVYQFYHNEQANDGEYILLTETINYRGMKIPKVRKWYMNADDKYLGVDILNAVKSF
ncbi:MAG: DUF6503 family protein [Fulvivirga sp.]